MADNPINKNINELSHFYDKVIAEIMTNIVLTAKEDHCYHITNFDYDDKNHLCILHICVILNEITHFPITIKANFRDKIKIWLIKRYRHIKYTNKLYTNEVNCEKIDQEISDKFENPYLLTDIYDTYYKEQI